MTHRTALVKNSAYELDDKLLMYLMMVSPLVQNTRDQFKQNADNAEKT